jgi:acyl carrier protein
LHHQLENWEKRKSLGNPISISTLTQHVTLEEIRQLNPSIIHRIYLLLATETSESPLPSQVTHRPKSDLDTADDSDLAETVRGSLAVVLELPEVDPNVPFQNYGLDSITAVVLSGRLERSLNLEIPPKWFINFPTVNSLSSHLSTQKVLAKKLDS